MKRLGSLAPASMIDRTMSSIPWYIFNDPNDFAVCATTVHGRYRVVPGCSLLVELLAARAVPSCSNPLLPLHISGTCTTQRVWYGMVWYGCGGSSSSTKFPQYEIFSNSRTIFCRVITTYYLLLPLSRLRHRLRSYFVSHQTARARIAFVHLQVGGICHEWDLGITRRRSSWSGSASMTMLSIYSRECGRVE